MKRVVFAVVIVLGTASAAVSACDKPSAPAIPDPSSAVTAQMVKAQNEVKAYISNAEQYLDCEPRSMARDEVAEEMQSVADEFNKSVRAFKARMENA